MNEAEAWDHFCADLGVWALRGYGIFAITEQAHDRAIGYTGIWFPPDIEEPELCWSFFRVRQGRAAPPTRRPPPAAGLIELLACRR